MNANTEITMDELEEIAREAAEKTDGKFHPTEGKGYDNDEEDLIDAGKTVEVTPKWGFQTDDVRTLAKQYGLGYAPKPDRRFSGNYDDDVVVLYVKDDEDDETDDDEDDEVENVDRERVRECPTCGEQFPLGDFSICTGCRHSHEPQLVANCADDETVDLRPFNAVGASPYDRWRVTLDDDTRFFGTEFRFATDGWGSITPLEGVDDYAHDFPEDAVVRVEWFGSDDDADDAQDSAQLHGDDGYCVECGKLPAQGAGDDWNSDLCSKCDDETDTETDGGRRVMTDGGTDVYGTALQFLFGPSDDDRVTLVYDSSYGGEQRVEGYVENAGLSECTDVVTLDGEKVYRVANDDFARRDRGDVLVGDRHEVPRRKVGTFTEARPVEAETDGGVDVDDDDGPLDPIPDANEFRVTEYEPDTPDVEYGERLELTDKFRKRVHNFSFERLESLMLEQDRQFRQARRQDSPIPVEIDHARRKRDYCRTEIRARKRNRARRDGE